MAATRHPRTLPDYETTVSYLCDAGIFAVKVDFVVSYNVNPGTAGGWNGDGYDADESAFVEDHKIERIESISFEGRPVWQSLGDYFVEETLLPKLQKELGGLVNRGEFDAELLKGAGF